MAHPPRSEKSAEAVLAGDPGEGPNGREGETHVGLEGKGPQMARQLELPLEGRGEAPRAKRSEEEPTAAHGSERSGTGGLMERVVTPANLQAACKRVRKNKGSAGVDGMRVEELAEYLQQHGAELCAQLLSGTCQPQLVKRVEIPKPGGGVRQLSIPTVVDRFTQQALLQVLQARIDPSVSPHSYGFRPGRSAHDAVRQAQAYIQAGCKWVWWMWVWRSSSTGSTTTCAMPMPATSTWAVAAQANGRCDSCGSCSGRCG